MLEKWPKASECRGILKSPSMMDEGKDTPFRRSPNSSNNVGDGYSRGQSIDGARRRRLARNEIFKDEDKEVGG